MRNRSAALAAVIAFAGTVSAGALVAGSDGGDELAKLPVATTGPATAEDASASSARAAVHPAVGPVEYRLAGELPPLASTAPAYRLDAGASGSAVARLAGVLGLAGAVGEDDHGWFVRQGDRELRVQKAPGLPWRLGPACPDASMSSTDGTTTRVACVATTERGVAVAGGATGEAADGGRSSSPGRPTSPPDAPTEAPPSAPSEEREEPAPPPRPADLPGHAEAERVARALFARLGVGAEGVMVEDAYSTWEARAPGRVGGLTVVRWSTTASIGEGGRLVGASGMLGEPERIGDYPLAGTPAGFDRLRRQATAAPVPLIGEDVSGAERADCSAPTVICDPPPGGEPAPAAPVVRTVTGARLALLHLDDALVPVYLFELEGGDLSPPVPAVVDEWLDAPGSVKP